MTGSSHPDRATGVPGTYGTAARAAVLVTDGEGRVLLVRTGDDEPSSRWGLPCAEVAAGETPVTAAERAMEAATGLIPRLGGLLVVDWVLALPGARGGVPVHVFDAGRLSASALRRVHAAQSGPHTAFAAPAELAAYAPGAESLHTVAALEARADGNTRVLEDGHEPAARRAMRDYGIVPAVHSGSAWVWHEGPVPAELPVQHAWVWVFVPDGRVVVYLDARHETGLPGGTLEDFEHRDARAAAIREVREETQIEIGEPVHLGYLVDSRPGHAPVARVRMAAAATFVGPSAPDPATGTVHRRLLVPPALVADVCGWGPSARRQTTTAVEAAARFGVKPADETAPVTEIPADGYGALPAGAPVEGLG
ncbi:NUDIX domain-containing protein [Streptomyces sp. NPDC012935]|uniref:NUDIX hydrolase n=1 Tax=Streptomyces sp. NPDC012935 TaxID=3364857 RepID=UPI0036C231F0